MNGTRTTGIRENSRFWLAGCGILAALALATNARATDYTNVAPSGAWDTNTTWTPSTSYPQLAGDTATILSNVVTLVGGVFAIPALQRIDLAASGSKTGTLYFAANVWQAAPLQLNGGILKLDHNYPNGCLVSNSLTVKRDSQIYAVGNGNGSVNSGHDLYGAAQDWVQGGVTNTGAIRVTGDSNKGYIRLRGAGSSFAGGWDITGGSAYPGFIVGGDGSRPAGGVAVFADGGLGSGTATVHTTLRVWSNQTATAAAPPPAKIVVQPAYDMAGVWLGVETFSPGYLSVTNWTMEFYGGSLVFSDRESLFSGGVLTAHSNLTFAAKRDNRWPGISRYGGEIRGSGRITINPYWFDNAYGYPSSVFYLSGNSTNFTGGVTLLGNNLYLQHTNALGRTGDCWFAAGDAGVVYLQNAAGAVNWTLGNNLGGINTVQVENASVAYTLTTPGTTLRPGTNVNACGKLTIAGNLAFGTDAVGGTSTLVVDVSGTNGMAGVDFDQLVVTRTLTNLNNATLIVNVATNLTKDALAGQELVVATNATSLVGTFASVSFSGAWHGKAAYNQPAGTVKLTQLSAEPSSGTVLFVQ